ncbi:MAG: hypothetical protein ACN4ES_06020 [Cellulophaga baltica]
MTKKSENSRLKPILISAVILIWGAIIYRAIFMVKASPNTHEAAYVDDKLTDKYKFTADTFSVSANFRDPFIGKIGSSIPNGTKKYSSGTKKKVVKKEKPKVTPCSWPSISFGGIIHNNNANRDIALLRVNGKKRLVKEGDIISELSVMSVSTDSIIVSNKFCTKTFYRVR